MFVMSKEADWPTLKTGHAVAAGTAANHDGPILSLVDNTGYADRRLNGSDVRLRVNGRPSGGFSRGVMIGALLVLPFWLLLGWCGLSQGNHHALPAPAGHRTALPSRQGAAG